VRVCERKGESCACGGWLQFPFELFGWISGSAISDIGDEDLHANEFARTNYTSAYWNGTVHWDPMNCADIGFQFKIFFLAPLKF
jgi:hypothetical protein